MVVSWVERVEEFSSRERAAALDGSDAGIYESASRTDESVGPGHLIDTCPVEPGTFGGLAFSLSLELVKCSANAE